MSDVKEIVGAVAFKNGRQMSFRISAAELELNSPEQLGELLLQRIQDARAQAAELRAEPQRNADMQRYSGDDPYADMGWRLP
jgi:hypothetical protein